MAASPRLILASASPRRKELLAAVGVSCEVKPADVDESRQPSEVVKQYVERVAVAKAQSVANKRIEGNIVILSADTVVVEGQNIFGKPNDQEDAFQMWQKLSDRTHNVITSVCLLAGQHLYIETVSTEVCFDQISERQMQRYWASGEPMDKAGGYAIQGLASAWVKFIHGSYSNVVGLPMYEVNAMLKKVGLNWS